jgi:hypothetical protein
VGKGSWIPCGVIVMTCTCAMCVVAKHNVECMVWGCWRIVGVHMDRVGGARCNHVRDPFTDACQATPGGPEKISKIEYCRKHSAHDCSLLHGWA